MRAIEAQIRGKNVIRYELFLPDDFQPDHNSVELSFSSDQKSFTAPAAISENLQLVRTAQIANNQIEHGFIRVRLDGKDLVLLTPLSPLKGTNSGLSYDVYHATPVGKPIEIIDFIHSHTLNQDLDSAISNLFSPEDIKDMGSKFGQRYWLLGPDGSASCLINSGFQVFEDEFAIHTNKYQNIFNLSKDKLTYAQALKAFKECIRACNLRYFRSSDTEPSLLNFVAEGNTDHNF